MIELIQNSGTTLVTIAVRNTVIHDCALSRNFSRLMIFMRIGLFTKSEQLRIIPKANFIASLVEHKKPLHFSLSTRNI